MNLDSTPEIWHGQNGLYYIFEEHPHRTHARIRGNSWDIAEVVYQLSLLYKTPQYTPTEIQETMKTVLESGKQRTGDVFIFKDDRVQMVRRMDYLNVTESEPLSGSTNHLEIMLTEQYGYTARRETLKNNVLTAIDAL